MTVLGSLRRWKLGLGILATTMMVVGCLQEPQFSANRLHIKRLELEVGVPLGDQELADVAEATEQLFGTADSPVVLQGVDVVSEDAVRQVAGRVYSDEQDKHFGLYRKHCIRCHGTTGNGRGPAARLLSPYPREFTLGQFKFKSTPLGERPAKEDLVKVLREGIPGTSMPSFATLRGSEIEALADYVIYLSVRGQTERELLAEVAMNLDYSRGDRLIDFSVQHAGSSQFDQAWQKATQVARNYYNFWKDSQKTTVPLPETPVWGSEHWAIRKPGDQQAELRVAVNSQAQSQALTDSIERGKQLFQSSLASCAKCHAADGSGANAPLDYDDWTKDWTTAVGRDPADKASIKPLLAAGGLKPVPMQPRDLRSGVFRGGASPDQIYLRIVNGIEGTSMPAAALQPKVADGLTQGQVWDLVNYVLSLSQAKEVL